jgi:hypothetical protein
MNRSENGDFAREFLIEVAGIGRGLKLGDKWRRNAFVIDVVEVYRTEVWMSHNFKGICFT